MLYAVVNKNEIKKSLVEVQAIIEKLSEEEYMKIPYKIKSYINNNKDNNYIWKYDENHSLEEQSLNKYTLPILAYINTEYLLNKEQKIFMNAVYEENDKRLERQLQKKYNSYNFFKNNN